MNKYPYAEPVVKNIGKILTAMYNASLNFSDSLPYVDHYRKFCLSTLSSTSMEDVSGRIEKFPLSKIDELEKETNDIYDDLEWVTKRYSMDQSYIMQYSREKVKLFLKEKVGFNIYLK